MLKLKNYYTVSGHKSKKTKKKITKKFMLDLKTQNTKKRHGAVFLKKFPFFLQFEEKKYIYYRKHVVMSLEIEKKKITIL